MLAFFCDISGCDCSYRVRKSQRTWVSLLLLLAPCYENSQNSTVHGTYSQKRSTSSRAYQGHFYIKVTKDKRTVRVTLIQHTIPTNFAYRQNSAQFICIFITYEVDKLPEAPTSWKIICPVALPLFLVRTGPPRHKIQPYNVKEQIKKVCAMNRHQLDLIQPLKTQDYP